MSPDKSFERKYQINNFFAIDNIEIDNIEIDDFEIDDFPKELGNHQDGGGRRIRTFA